VLFAQIVSAAFGQRRKTLRNTLRSFLNETEFEQLGHHPPSCARESVVAEFARIAAYLDARA